jgi:hypothetical protein
MWDFRMRADVATDCTFWIAKSRMRSMDNSMEITHRKGSVRRGSVDGAAEAQLAKMGYQSELPRNLSMLSVLGL